MQLSAVPRIAVNKEKDSVFAKIKVVSANQSEAPLSVKLVSDLNSKDEILRRIDDYCLSHLDRFVTVISLGSQNYLAILVKLVIVQKTFYPSKYG